MHVESEVDRILKGLTDHPTADPVVLAAWVHHRFTQVHPYQDGNGRVARAITLLVLLRGGLLPLVIDRDLRTEYIASLEDADRGDLGPLARLFARLERAAILQALSIDADTEIARDKTLTSAVIESLAAKFSKRREQKDADLRTVDRIAVELRQQARKGTERALNALKGPLKDLGEPEIHLVSGGPELKNAHWYKFEVIKSGESSGKYINFGEAHYFIKATTKVETQRLVFVVSLHHVGRELTGVMEATAFARLESFEEPNDKEYVSQQFFPCALEPFVFTWKSKAIEIAASFDRWLDAALAVALQEYGNRL
ncbi:MULTISPECIES: Fic family protein [unclassified Corallococcus]|uniref:Fic family protein n=1 Tax=unclassified Corallococcus TaxID=2685029 RepID=UPI001A8FD3E6|nr:Fic family protein [Corallococcus sp. NCRR]MBN9685895.1 Fic family protein [Corallococcus sp. NCSPR001]WAS82664.1 Fic family protein [Corallococcus sp. NCRR]